MPTLGLIAHDSRKPALLRWTKEHRDQLATWSLCATGTTGALVERELGLPVKKFLSGPLGGDLQIGAMVATGQILAVLFLRDPLTAHPHEPDISALMKACDTHNVPLATNAATAEYILSRLEAAAPRAGENER